MDEIRTVRVFADGPGGGNPAPWSRAGRTGPGRLRTGLYPYAVSDAGAWTFDARQFPRSSGYPEDPATGLAAAALTYGLLADGLIDRSAEPVRVRQGRAMGRPSAIEVTLGPDGCWIGGPVEPA